MTNPNKSFIGVILDRSGSMAGIANDMKGGLNSFLDQQRLLPGECVCSIMQFDYPNQNEYIVRNQNINSISSIDTYTPRGSTALFDAIGEFIVDSGEYLSSLQEEDRPGKVLILIITDGQENSSKEYSGTRVKEMISHQTEKYSWEFTYLGVSSLSLQEASSIGVSNTIRYSTENLQAAFKNLSRDTASYRAAAVYSAGTGSFTSKEDYTE